jgi:phosphate transport system protein
VNVISDLERIGDHAEGIAKVALMLGNPATRSIPPALDQMGEAVTNMLERGLDAFARRDVGEARRICAEDDDVDARYESIYGQLIAAMTENADAVVPSTYLLWATHNLERIADRVTNICERTVYLTTGTVEELNVSNH